MPLRRTGTKRPSAQNIALVQMQIAAQARNQRWHDFLCGKRDELQARLRQQGYTPGPTSGYLPAGHAGSQSGSDVAAQPASESPEPPARWGESEQRAEERMLDAAATDPTEGRRDGAGSPQNHAVAYQLIEEQPVSADVPDGISGIGGIGGVPGDVVDAHAAEALDWWKEGNLGPQ